MNNITWEYLLEILQYTKNYENCFQLLITCKTLYQNKQLNKLIKQFYTQILIDEYDNKYWYFYGELEQCYEYIEKWSDELPKHNSNKFIFGCVRKHIEYHIDGKVYIGKPYYKPIKN